MKKGTFIVITGINGIGKSEQVTLLSDFLKRAGHDVVTTKYAHYTAEPYGVLVNQYLREGNPHNLTPARFQALQALERSVFEPQLLQWISEGKIVIAEDYTETSYAWGIAAGVSFETLYELNKGLKVPNKCILLDGVPFGTNIEIGHVHEDNQSLILKVKEVFLDLSQKPEFAWSVVSANRTREEVHAEIVSTIG